MSRVGRGCLGDTVPVLRLAPPIRVGVVVPVHNEERLLGHALDALGRAAEHARSAMIECRMVVVLDDCSDDTAGVVERWRRGSSGEGSSLTVDVIAIQDSSVGAARSAGCASLLRAWAEVAPTSIWIATTDGDSEVPEEWISGQLHMFGQGADLWAGTVAVADWTDRIEGTAEMWTGRYAGEEFPVHGANLGCSASTYLRVGGFDPVATGEDRALVERALAAGLVVRHHHQLRVVTSGRRMARAPHGFAHALTRIEAAVPLDCGRLVQVGGR